MDREIRDGILYFDGCNTLSLAKTYGTPLYVMSETGITSRFNELKRDFIHKYPETRVAYACKAFCTKAMLSLCEKEGMCIDVVSGGELYTAISAGFPAERIEFNGNNKLPEELEMAMDYGIGRIIVDGPAELAMIEEICRKKHKTAKVLFRITPGVKADSHDYIVTGKKDSKFGIPLDEDVLYPQVAEAVDSPYVDFLGFHFHVGSQLADNRPYLEALEVMLCCVAEVKKRYGCDVRELNIGGGFGVTYTNEVRRPYAYFLAPVMQRIQEAFAAMGMAQPAVVVEPGRSIVAEEGISLYTVGNIKDIRGVRKYVSVDGGMGDNIRPALYQAVYDGVVAGKADREKDDVVTVCGKYCESGDILIGDCRVTSAIASGDIFAVYGTGAYGYAMASNYNRNPVPAVVLVKEGRHALIVKRQTFADIVANDLMPVL